MALLSRRQRVRRSQANGAEDILRQIEDFGVEEDEVEDHDEPWRPSPAPIHVAAGGCEDAQTCSRRVNKIRISTPKRFKL
jgi:hypothetical protein